MRIVQSGTGLAETSALPAGSELPPADAHCMQTTNGLSLTVTDASGNDRPLQVSFCPLAARTVTITATDGGAGVKQLLYSLDGTTFQPYTAPFVVDATQTLVVYAFADDNVANRSSLVTWRLAWPIYLPLTVR